MLSSLDLLHEFLWGLRLSPLVSSVQSTNNAYRWSSYCCGSLKKCRKFRLSPPPYQGEHGRSGAGYIVQQRSYLFYLIGGTVNCATLSALQRRGGGGRQSTTALFLLIVLPTTSQSLNLAINRRPTFSSPTPYLSRRALQISRLNQSDTLDCSLKYLCP